MTLVFDLDHTLFDTTSFKEDLFRIFQASGASQEIIEASYQEHLKQVGGSYDFEMHAATLEKNYPSFDKSMALQQLTVFEHGDYRKYVRKEVFHVLDELKKQKHRLVLLTKGSEKVQRQKIERSGLQAFFDEIIICQGDKTSALVQLGLGIKDCFINDHWGETKAIRDLFPKLRYFLLKRPDLEQYHSLSEIDVPIILSLEELLEKVN